MENTVLISDKLFIFASAFFRVDNTEWVNSHELIYEDDEDEIVNRISTTIEKYFHRFRNFCMSIIEVILRTYRVWYETPICHGGASVENVKFEACEVFKVRELTFVNNWFKHERNSLSRFLFFGKEIGVLYQALYKEKFMKYTLKIQKSNVLEKQIDKLKLSYNGRMESSENRLKNYNGFYSGSRGGSDNKPQKNDDFLSKIRDFLVFLFKQTQPVIKENNNKSNRMYRGKSLD